MFSWLLNLWLRTWFHDLRDIPDAKPKFQFPHWTMSSIYFWQERLLFFFIFVLQICCSIWFPFGNYSQHFGRLYLQQRFLLGTKSPSPPTSFSPLTSRNVGFGLENFLTFCQSQIIEPRLPLKKGDFSGQTIIKLRLW